jgi:uncharacterized membrane protein YoaK (UPF0700 family)
MPLLYLRRLTGRVRTRRANWELAGVLAFVAGATNAGGYLAVHQYTSHMSGVVSGIADSVVLGAGSLALAGLGALLPFVCGAAVTALMVNWGRRRRMHSEYALPLLLEAALLLVFAVLGRPLEQQSLMALPVTVMLLCFTMGLQNAVVTKLSRAEIRTTHVTGMITDIGIELGKAIYRNREVRADRTKLRLLSMLVGLFFVGGVLGALGFRYVGFLVEIPLAVLLVALGAMPVWDDVRR